MLNTKPAQKESTSSKKAPNKSWVEVANLWRDRRNGSFVFQIENEFYKQSSDLNTKRMLFSPFIRQFYCFPMKSWINIIPVHHSKCTLSNISQTYMQYEGCINQNTTENKTFSLYRYTFQYFYTESLHYFLVMTK